MSCEEPATNKMVKQAHLLDMETRDSTLLWSLYHIMSVLCSLTSQLRAHTHTCKGIYHIMKFVRNLCNVLHPLFPSKTQ